MTCDILQIWPKILSKNTLEILIVGDTPSHFDWHIAHRAKFGSKISYAWYVITFCMLLFNVSMISVEILRCCNLYVWCHDFLYIIFKWICSPIVCGKKYHEFSGHFTTQYNQLCEEENLFQHFTGPTLQSDVITFPTFQNWDCLPIVCGKKCHDFSGHFTT